jgi:hypothetical protein
VLKNFGVSYIFNTFNPLVLGIVRFNGVHEVLYSEVVVFYIPGTSWQETQIHRTVRKLKFNLPAGDAHTQTSEFNYKIRM